MWDFKVSIIYLDDDREIHFTCKKLESRLKEIQFIPRLGDWIDSELLDIVNEKTKEGFWTDEALIVTRVAVDLFNMLISIDTEYLDQEPCKDE